MRHIFISMEYLTFVPVSDQRRWRAAPRSPLAWEAEIKRWSGLNEGASVNEWHPRAEDPTPRMSLPIITLLMFSLLCGTALFAGEQPEAPAAVPAAGVRLKDLCDIYACAIINCMALVWWSA